MTNYNKKGGTIIQNGGGELIPRIPYDIKMFSGICIIGIIIRLFIGGQNDYATATVWGYGFSVLALLGLLISSFAIQTKDRMYQDYTGFFTDLLKNAIPIIFTICILSLILYQNIYFYENINSGKVAPQYYQFSGASAFLIIVQVCFVIRYLSDILSGSSLSNDNNYTYYMLLASKMSSIIIILTVANIGIIGILQVILQFFSTDG